MYALPRPSRVEAVGNVHEFFRTEDERDLPKIPGKCLLKIKKKIGKTWGIGTCLVINYTSKCMEYFLRSYQLGNGQMHGILR